MRYVVRCCVPVLACLVALPAVAGATALGPFLDVTGQGLTVVAGGVGLLDTRAGDVTVDIPGPVQTAILYWGGRDRPCPLPCTTPPKDQDLLFDGTPVSGTVIGTEYQPVSAGGPINNIGYSADVTAIVAARGTGSQTFHVADGNLASNLYRLDGASLLVICTDPTQPGTFRIMVQQGLDEAWGHDPTPGETRVTTPVTFSYDATIDARVADLWIIGGDSEPTRPNRLQVSNNADRWNTLNASDGIWWDTDRWPTDIPAGSGATSVQYFSEAPPTSPGLNPSSILWEVAVLRLGGIETGGEPPPPPPGDQGCSPGYFKNHTGSWPAAYSPGQAVGSVFSAASAYPSLASQSLLAMLGGGGGPGTLGGARILLRAGVAALLNAESSGVDYPETAADVIDAVNDALSSGDRATMLALASQLDGQNNLGCPLS